MSEYDVVVCGGGPSGATTAFYAAKAGLRVALVDRAKFPRDKACGGLLTPRVLSELPELAPWIEPIIECPSHDVQLYSPSMKYCIDFDFGSNTPWNIRREVFDNALLEAAREAGMGLRIHADEFGDTGGGTLGAELKVTSADHLAGSTMETIEALRDAGVTGILLPGTPLALLSSEFAPARKMVAAGLPLALATDCNPNCYTESMQMVMQLAVFRMGLMPAEALTAATLNGALALGRSNRGAIAPGWRADLLVCDVPDYRHLTYHFGINHVETVIIGGRVVNA